MAKGIETRAHAVDHIIPARHGGSFWDPRNHQSLSEANHNRKSATEKALGQPMYQWVLNERGHKIPKRDARGQLKLRRKV